MEKDSYRGAKYREDLCACQSGQMGVGVKVVADGGYIGQQLIFFLRIILAMLCGGIIGIAASITPGIGILGGIIITGKQGHVSGTTTAAGLMATIAIGMAFGSGMYILGFAVTMLVL